MRMMASSKASEAWKNCCDEGIGAHIQGGALCADSLTSLVSRGFGRNVGLWALRKLENDFEKHAKLQFSKIIQDASSDHSVLPTAVRSTHKGFTEDLNSLELLEKRLPSQCHSIRRRFARRAGTLLQSLAPPNFCDLLYDALSRKASQFLNDLAHAKSNNPPISPFEEDELCAQLAELGFSRTVQEAISWISFEKIDVMASDNEFSKLNAHIFPKLVWRIEGEVIPWLSTVAIASETRQRGYEITSNEVSSSCSDHLEKSDVVMRKDILSRWRKRLLFHLHEKIASLRTKQILQIIEDFPSSVPAVEDLSACLTATDYRPVFISSLRSQFSAKLLNAGTTTSEILIQYVNLIKTLEKLDSTGVILDLVSTPIRNYLKDRPDTVRCIVNDMTSDGALYSELEHGPSRRRTGIADVSSSELASSSNIDEDQISIDGDFDENGIVDVDEYKNWQPEPMDAPVRSNRHRHGGDAIAALVSIYGSSDQIVSEYRTLLADRLIHDLNLNMEKELKVLELLTERFGKNAMNECAIMLKDVADSQALDSTMRLDSRYSLVEMETFETIVVSKEFWPKLKSETKFEASSVFRQYTDLFTETFEQVKEPRKLLWHANLGTVSVDLTFDDGRKLEISVSPLQAHILQLFQEKKKWSVDDLREKLKVEDADVFKKSFTLLCNKGILKASDSAATCYEVIEFAGDAEAGTTEDDPRTGAEDGDEIMERTDSDMKVYESYILAMLQNLKALPLERIHNMLKMFVKTPAYEKTQGQLADFLADLVAQNKIEVQAGIYKIKAKAS